MTPQPNSPAADRMANARAARAAKKAAGTVIDAAADGGISAKEVENITAAIDEVAELTTEDRAAIQRAEKERAALADLTPVGPTNNEKLAAKLEGDAAVRERAARQRVNAGLGAPEDTVNVRITKLGDGKVSMGQHVPGVGEAHYEWKETVTLPAGVAKALEERGFAEII